MEGPLFIGACPRSGTTLLGGMLGTGPDAFTVPEATFKWPLLATRDDANTVGSPDAHRILAGHWQFPAWSAPLPSRVDHSRRPLADLMEEFASAYASAESQTGRWWIDHTPGNVRYVTALLDVFPTARFVNLLRDGRGAVASVLPLQWGPSSIADGAQWWATSVAQGLAAERRYPDRVTTVRFEDLLTEPEQTIRRVCAFADLTYVEAMTQRPTYRPPEWTHDMHGLVGSRPDPARATAWTSELSGRQVEVFESVTQELLDYLGYPLSVGVGARPLTRGERAVGAARATRRLVTDKLRRVRLERRGFRSSAAKSVTPKSGTRKSIQSAG